MLPVDASVGTQDRDHHGPNNATGVVEHVYHRKSSARLSIRGHKDVSRGKWLLQIAEGSPKRKHNLDEERNAKNSYDVGMVGSITVVHTIPISTRSAPPMNDSDSGREWQRIWEVLACTM